MNRYQALFQRLSAAQQGAFVPFVTIGDPNPEQSLAIMQTLIDAGADALELGMPFSDPLADGPTIQGANLRALAAKTTPDICFELIAQIRARNPETPIGLLMYANLVYARGIDDFYQRCQKARGFGTDCRCTHQRKPAFCGGRREIWHSTNLYCATNGQ
ncbi:tryptophan synthase subunit alpha [Vibrio cholerae]|nr:tryptophan synthase subunit alpha [Vibrio cholerae]